MKDCNASYSHEKIRECVKLSSYTYIYLKAVNQISFIIFNSNFRIQLRFYLSTLVGIEKASIYAFITPIPRFPSSTILLVSSEPISPSKMVNYLLLEPLKHIRPKLLLEFRVEFQPFGKNSRSLNILIRIWNQKNTADSDLADFFGREHMYTVREICSMETCEFACKEHTRI